MSKERIVIGAGLCFASGVVLTLPPEFFQEVFSLPHLVARWLDAGVLACAGLWVGMVWAGQKEAALSGKVAEATTKIEQLAVQINGCHAGLAQFQAVLQQMQLRLPPVQVKP